MKQHVGNHGYPVVGLHLHNVTVPWPVHQLVLGAFVGDCPPGFETRHLDGNKLNSRLVNLVYGTRRENLLDRQRHGRRAFNAKLSNEQVREARERVAAGPHGTQRMVARELGVAESTLHHALRGDTYRNLKND
jgi:hypothetical protein